MAFANGRQALQVAILCAFATFVSCPVWAQSPIVSWSGPYVGAFGGGGGGQSAQQDSGIPVTPRPVRKPSPPAPPPVVVPNVINQDADGHYRISGGLGGALIGYNYQFNQIVIGAEGDIGGGSFTGRSAFCGTTPHLCGTRIDAEADVRGRLGLPIGRFLPYIAGGVAFADLHAYDSLFGTSGAQWRAGYTVGGGLEYKMTPRVGLRFEYLHSQFGQTALFNIVPGVPERISASTDVVRAGISFSLYDPTPAVIARY